MSAQPIRHVPPMFYRSNLQTALARRLYPKTALHRKVLAHGSGVHVDTIHRIIAGGGSSLETACKIADFFRRQGDPWFAYEVFGLEQHASRAPVAAALAALDQARQALLEGAAA